MANTFKNKTFDGSSTIANSDMIPYTAPSSTTTVVIGLTVANTSNNQITVDIKLDASTNIFLVKNLPIPAGSSFEYMSGNKINPNSVSNKKFMTTIVTRIQNDVKNGNSFYYFKVK